MEAAVQVVEAVPLVPATLVAVLRDQHIPVAAVVLLTPEAVREAALQDPVIREVAVVLAPAHQDPALVLQEEAAEGKSHFVYFLMS